MIRSLGTCGRLTHRQFEERHRLASEHQIGLSRRLRHGISRVLFRRLRKSVAFGTVAVAAGRTSVGVDGDEPARVAAAGDGDAEDADTGALRVNRTTTTGVLRGASTDRFCEAVASPSGADAARSDEDTDDVPSDSFNDARFVVGWL